MAAALVLLATACADVAPGGDVPQPAESAGAISTTPLPTLPPKWVLDPELWDEQGCTKLGEEQVVCPAPVLPGSAPEGDTSDPRVWRNLLGFEGPFYVDTLQAGAVIVLEQTLSTALTGSWRAMGLVRNETEVLTGADVTASIWGEDGTLLGDATSHVLVDPLRPGEPGPFVLDSSIPVAKVADVTWSVKATGTGSLGLRDFLITAPIWELPYGNRDRWDTDAEKEQPFPYVAYGSVDNLAAGVVRQPTIFAAWLDTEGRVRWVDSAVVGIAPNDPELSATLPDDLGPRWIGDFYFLVDDPDVARLFGDPASDGLEAMFWAGSDGYSEGG